MEGYNMAWTGSGNYELTTIMKDLGYGYTSNTRVDDGEVACTNPSEDCLLILKTGTTGDNNKINTCSLF